MEILKLRILSALEKVFPDEAPRAEDLAAVSGFRGEIVSFQAAVFLRADAAVRASLVLSLPCAVGLGVFGRRILSLFFERDSVLIAAPVLAVLSPGIVFLALVTVSNALLQAKGKAGVTVVSMAIGAITKIAVGYYLIGRPSVGIYGAAVGTVLCYAIAALFNFIALRREFGYLPEFSRLFRIIFPALSAYALSLPLLRILPIPGSPFSTLLLLSVAGLLYFPLCFLFGSVKKEDLALFPFGNRLLSMLYRKRAIK